MDIRKPPFEDVMAGWSPAHPAKRPCLTRFISGSDLLSCSDCLRNTQFDHYVIIFYTRKPMRKSRRVVIGVFSAVAVIIAVGALVWYSAYRSTQNFKVQASRAIVAWVFEGQPIPGFKGIEQLRGYSSVDVMRKADRWYVICDILPQDISLSDNPRIERISAEEAEAIHDQAITTREGSFLWIGFTHDRSGHVTASSNEIRLTAGVVYAVLGGDIYEFIFTKVDGQLNVTGKHTGGS
ncbi:MAG: hypothetical protein ACP5J4_19555 [Anaerolineae bacterium]